MDGSRSETKAFKVVLFSIVVVLAAAIVSVIAFAAVSKSYYIPSSAMAPTLTINDRLLANTSIYDLNEPRRGDVIVFRAPKEASSDGKEREFIKRVIASPGDTVRIVRGYVQVDDKRLDHTELRMLLSTNGDTFHKFVKLSEDSVSAGGKAISGTKLATLLNAKPGQRIKIVPGQLILNGKALDEPYVAEDPDMDYPIVDGDSQLATPKEWLTTVDGKPAVLIPEGRLLVMGDNRNNSNDSRYWGLLERSRVTGKAWRIYYPWNRRGAIK